MRNKYLLLICLTAGVAAAQSPVLPKPTLPTPTTSPSSAGSEKPVELAKLLVPAPIKSIRPSQLVDDERTSLQLAHIENQNNLIKAQAELAGSEAKLRSLRGDTRAPNGIPTLVGITGTPQQLTAKLQYDGQHVLYVRVGDMLPSGYELKSLNTKGATISKGSELIVVPLVFARQISSPSPSAQATPFIPIDSAGPIVGRNVTGSRQ